MTAINSDPSLLLCSVCQQVLHNPCVPCENFDIEGLPQTPPLLPARVAIIRAYPSAYYLTRAYACMLGRWMAHLKMPEREVRNFVTYKIYEGLAQGFTYQAPWGEEIIFEPDTIEEIFDGRKTEFRSASTPDFSDEIMSSDRVFGYLKTRAVNGKIGKVPDRRLCLRFMLVHLARATPSAEVSDRE